MKLPNPQPMVSWLAPRILLQSAQEVVLSKIFADFADKREAMAGLSDEAFPCGTDADGDFWLDYLSDTGDGFDSTHTMARLLAAPRLEVAGETLPRGAAVVLGGDEVYPSASWERYRERFWLPYWLALPEGPGPDMFAIPGNHDWYDGLTSFTRVFCQDKRVGGWQTRQRRSYFALQLPRRWWLFGIDIQFDAYVDGPQLDYFNHVIATYGIGAGDRVILATAKPSWVHVEDPDDPPVSWTSLAFFDEAVIQPCGARLAVTLTGDLHHYSRYSRPDGAEPKITAGGGGAYLSGTHPLPAALELPAAKVAGGPPARYVRGATFPEIAESRRLARGILGHALPTRTPTLGNVLAVVYGVISLLVASAVRDQATSFAGVVDHGLWTLAGDALAWTVVVVAVVASAALAAWADHGDAPWWIGVAHALAHVALAGVATILLLRLNPLGAADHGFWLGWEVAALVALVGVIAGRWVLVGYLWLAHSHDVRWHANEVLAAQGIADYKNFLRLKIDAEGELTVYALGVRRVPRWGLHDDRTRQVDPDRFPDGYVHLIEKVAVKAPFT